MRTEEIDTIYGTFVCWADDLVSRQLRAFSAHTRNELAMVRRFVAPGDFVVDVGGHIGTYAIPFAQFVGPGGRVLTFEASPQNFELLQRNIAANGLQATVEAVHAVVTDGGGKYGVQLPTGGNSGMFYVVPVAGNDGIPAAGLDAWLEHSAVNEPVSLLKIDVEGSESGVLRSAMRTVARDLPALYIEICPASLERFGASLADIEGPLHRLGYQFFRNVGERNSTNDHFTMVRLPGLAHGGPFFDLLAVHPASRQYGMIRAILER